MICAAWGERSVRVGKVRGEVIVGGDAMAPRGLVGGGRIGAVSTPPKETQHRMIEVESAANVTLVRLRHGKVNALDVELLGELADRLGQLGDEGAGGVVLTGNGRVFSAGVDLVRVLDGGRAYIDRLIPALAEVFASLFVLPRPVVAAIEGAAVAGGCILACACDYRLVAQDAGPIGASELVVGVPFPVAALEVLRHASGRHTDDLVYTGRLLAPDEAVALGLVHETVPAEGLVESAVARAEALSRIPASAFRLTKGQLRGPVLERIARDSARVDAEVRRAWSSAEATAGIAAQLDRLRAPRPA